MVGVAGSTAWRGWATTAAASAPSTRSRAPASGWAPAPARTSCPSHISKVRSPGPAPRVSSALCRERRHPEEARPVLPAGEGEVGGQAELLQPEQPGQPHQRPHDGRGRARPRAQVRLQAGHLLLGCRENTEVTQWIPRRYSRGESTILMLNFSSSPLSTPSVQYLHLPSPLPLSADLLQSLTQALRDAASARGHPAHPGYSTLDTAPVLTEELKRHLAETRAVNEYR